MLSINGREVDEPNELQRAVAIHRPGDRLKLEVWRDQELRVFYVELFGKNDSSYTAWRAALAEQEADDRILPPEFEPPNRNLALKRIQLLKWTNGALGSSSLPIVTCAL